MHDRADEPRLPDLLRERRHELGLPDHAGLWHPARPLLLRGALIAGVAVFLSAGSIVVMGWIEGQQQQQLQALAPFEQRVRTVERRLRTAKQQVATVRQDNQQIAEQKRFQIKANIEDRNQEHTKAEETGKHRVDHGFLTGRLPSLHALSRQ